MCVGLDVCVCVCVCVCLVTRGELENVEMSVSIAEVLFHCFSKVKIHLHKSQGHSMQHIIEQHW